MAFSRLKAAVNRVRGTVPRLKADEDFMKQANVPSDVMERLGEKAALSCTWLCRKFIRQNMAAAGVVSKQILEVVDQSYAYFAGYKGVVKFRMAPGKGMRRNDKRKEKQDAALYIQAASLDAGWVVGGKDVGDKAKRRIKAGLADEKTLRAVRQEHLVEGAWKTIERGRINLGAIKVVPGRKFFEFNPAQQEQIRVHFRKNLAGLLVKYGYGKVG